MSFLYFAVRFMNSGISKRELRRGTALFFLVFLQLISLQLQAF